MNRSPRHVRCTPLSLDDVRPSTIDLIVSVSGYEPRCTHMCERLGQLHGPDAFRRLLLLPFASHRDLPSRKEADAFYERLNPAWTMDVSTDDGLKVREKVRKLISNSL
jgi:hypothetical protein